MINFYKLYSWLYNDWFNLIHETFPVFTFYIYYINKTFNKFFFLVYSIVKYQMLDHVYSLETEKCIQNKQINKPM